MTEAAARRGEAAPRRTCSPPISKSSTSKTHDWRRSSPSCWRTPMRPNRLELEGFTSFRNLAVVDFEGADVFALSGPTGAGKSSIVDAMGFALYGRVHRYGDKL